MAARSGPFSTQALFEPLPTLALPKTRHVDKKGSPAFAYTDDDTFALDDKLDFDYRTTTDLSLAETLDLDLPEWTGLNQLVHPGRLVDRSLTDSISNGSWALCTADIELESVSRLQCWHVARLLDTRQASHCTETFRPDLKDVANRLADLNVPLSRLSSIADHVHHSDSQTLDPARIALSSCLLDLVHAVGWTITHEQVNDKMLPMLLHQAGHILEQCAAAHSGIETVILLVRSLNSQNVSNASSTLLLPILSRVSTPLMQAVLGHVGLVATTDHAHHCALPTELHILALAAAQTCPSDQDTHVSSQIMTEREVALIASTHHYLAHLRRLDPRHPLVEPRAHAIPSHDLARLTSSDPFHLEGAAGDYERIADHAIATYHANHGATSAADSRHHTATLTTVSDPPTQPPSIAHEQTSWSSLSDKLDRPPDTALTTSANLIQKALKASMKEQFTNVGKVSPLAQSIALLQVQARLVHTSIARTLFETCHLKHHLNFLRDKYLLGDGAFLQRLCSVLFQNDAHELNQQKARSGASLVFDARDSQLWLPADSHMRIALEDTLTDMSRMSSTASRRQPHDHAHDDAHRSLEPRLSSVTAGFSTYTPSPSELTELADAGLVHALELVSLKYTVPSDLVAQVISKDALAQYDDCFRYVLRAQRVLHVAAQTKYKLVSARQHSRRAGIGDMDHGSAVQAEKEEHDVLARRFVSESHQFAMAVCGYFDTSISCIWRRFETRLAELHANLTTAASVRLSGIAEIRDLHLRTLGRVQRCLFMDEANGVDEPSEKANMPTSSRSIRACLTRCFSLIVRGCAMIESSRAGNSSPQQDVGGHYTNLRDLHDLLHQSITELIRSLLDLGDADGTRVDGAGSTLPSAGKGNDDNDEDMMYDEDEDDGHERHEGDEWHEDDGRGQKALERGGGRTRRIRGHCHRLAELLDGDGYYSMASSSS